MGDVVRQSISWYAQGDPNNPRHDPTTYRKRIMDVLRANQGVAVHLEPIVGGDCWAVQEAVKVLRRIGWQIDGEKGTAGYTLVDIDPPEGWLRLVESIRKDEKKPRRFTPRDVALIEGQIPLAEVSA